jgi:hypothetical protein
MLLYGKVFLFRNKKIIKHIESEIFIKLVIEHIIISYIVSIFNKFKKLIYFEF